MVKGVKAVFSFFFIYIEAVQQEKVQLTQRNSTSKFSVITENLDKYNENLIY